MRLCVCAFLFFFFCFCFRRLFFSLSIQLFISIQTLEPAASSIHNTLCRKYKFSLVSTSNDEFCEDLALVRFVMFPAAKLPCFLICRLCYALTTRIQHINFNNSGFSLKKLKANEKKKYTNKKRSSNYNTQQARLITTQDLAKHDQRKKKKTISIQCHVHKIFRAVFILPLFQHRLKCMKMKQAHLL